MGELKYLIFHIGIGWVGILGSTAGLQRVTLPRHSAREISKMLGVNQKQATISHRHFQDLSERLTAYYAGLGVDFPDRVDPNTGTPFQRAVWEATRLIPYGETRSYTWVARQIGKPEALRAVGQALGRNPLSVIIPCHRVLAGDGGLGGFSGGLEVKRFLLRLEAAGRY